MIGRSLRWRLMAVLSVSILAAWLATATFTYLDARAAVDALLGDERQLDELRTAIAESIAAHLMHPLWVAVPLLAALIWGSVAWGLGPLRKLTDEVASRDPQNLEPLAVAGPAETQPLVTALGGLLSRVGDLLENERRFTADAAHELRTPLAVIRTHAQVALAATDEAERRQALAGVVGGTERAAHLVDQLLFLARLEAALNFEDTDLAALAAAVVAEYSIRAEAKGIDLGLEPQAAGMIRGNPHLLSVLLRNLVDNAIRYGKPGGKVDVSVGSRDGQVVLEVADNGPGIPADLRDAPFGRFRRGLGTGEEGSGLGLSIVAAVAARHLAAITIESGQGKSGVTARVAFPALS